MANEEKNPFNSLLNFGDFKPDIIDNEEEKLSGNQQLADSMLLARFESTSRVKNSKLQALRAQCPFIPILPTPDKVLSVVTTANKPMDFNIPSGTQMVKFKGTGDYYISLNGNASVPTNLDTSTNNFNGAMYKPEDTFLFCSETLSMSVVSPVDGVVVVMQCYIQL